MRNERYIPVMDSAGRPIPGLSKSSKTGTIIAEKNNEYQRYLREKENLEQVHSLTGQVESLQLEVDELKQMIRDNLKNE